MPLFPHHSLPPCAERVVFLIVGIAFIAAGVGVMLGYVHVGYLAGIGRTGLGLPMRIAVAVLLVAIGLVLSIPAATRKT